MRLKVYAYRYHKGYEFEDLEPEIDVEFKHLKVNGNKMEVYDLADGILQITMDRTKYNYYMCYRTAFRGDVKEKL